MNRINEHPGALCALLVMSLLLVMALAVAAEAAATLEYRFAGPSATEGWSHTPKTRLEPGDDHLTLHADGWDSKIYRRITLPAGRYVMSGEGAGKIRAMIQPSDWSARPVAELTIAQGADWRKDYRDIELEAGTYWLVVHVTADKGEGRIRWLTLGPPPQDAAAPEQTPTPEQLAAERPVPEVVRGFMVPTNLDADGYAALREWGANVVRLQFNLVQHARQQKLPLWEAWPSLLDTLEEKVLLARSHGLKVVLDLHGLPVEGVRGDQPEAWAHPDLEANILRVWRDIATRMQPHREVIWGYDLLNEPLDRQQLPWAPREWRPLALKILAAIREIDRETWIIYEPGPGSLFRGIENLKPLPDTRIIYSIHWYQPQTFTHQGVGTTEGTDLVEAKKRINIQYPGRIDDQEWNREMMERHFAAVDEFQSKWRVPIYVGEFGVIRWAPPPAPVNWLRDAIESFEKRGWSWTYHAFREWPGWSLEHAEDFWKPGMPDEVLRKRAEGMTDRGRLVRSYLERNAAAQ